jgi:hypothetical protein
MISFLGVTGSGGREGLDVAYISFNIILEHHRLYNSAL